MAFNLDDFVVEQPKGLLIEQHADDKDEEQDVAMAGFSFDYDGDSNDEDIEEEHDSEMIEPTNDDESNHKNKNTIDTTAKKVNKNLMNLARANTDLSFMTSIEAKIAKWKEKYTSRMKKTYKKNPKLREEDDKWHKNIQEARKKVAKKKKKRHSKNDDYTECGDRSADFALLGVSRILLQTIRRDLKWNHPTSVQRETIPLALKGHDLLINAVTGSGKSGAFIIPILERLILSELTELNERRVLIITPTRELAIQLYEIFKIFIKTLKKLSVSIPIIGGVPVEKQYSYLTAHRCDVIVATPGRLIDLIRNYFTEQLDLVGNIEILCLDEADRLLSMGFQPELFEIFKYLPSKEFRQNILCSATLSDSVLSLAQISLNHENMKRVSVDPSLAVNAKKLTQEFIRLHSGQEKYRKAMLLALLLTSFHDKKCIIFCRTKKETHLMRIICSFFDLPCIELHGDLSQFDRLKYLEQFKNDGSIKFLFCTDIASRGIDILAVDLVINMEFPTNIKTYIHRVGRTARAGHSGYSCCFVSDSRKKLLKKLIASDVNKKGVIKSRTLNNEFVVWCFNKINDIKNETQPLLKSENKERDMRLMHIRLKRSENLLVHGKQIFSKQKKSWIMGKNDKISVRKEAQRKDLGAVEARRLAEKDKEKTQRKRELEWSSKAGKKAISMKKKMRRELREQNKTKTGMKMEDAVDMIRNPFKYNKNIKRNIENRMKKKRKYQSNMNNSNPKRRFKSSLGGPAKKYDNKQLRKKMSAKGNKTRFKNRRK
eukprot:217717_1